MLLLGFLLKGWSIVGNSSNSLWTMDPYSLSVLNDSKGRRMLKLFSVYLDDVIYESCIFLMSSVDLSVVEIWVFVENLSLDGLSVFIILSLKV